MDDMHFTFRLDLVVRLLDTTTGIPIAQRQIFFSAEGQVLKFFQRGIGVFILMNQGRKDMKLTVDAAGYESRTIDICYDALSTKFPEIEVPMIPKVKEYGYNDILTLEGEMPGMESIDAVPWKFPCAVAAKYLAPRRLMKLFSAKSLEERSYALIHEDSMEFEEFLIAGKQDKLTLVLRYPLEGACAPEETITRIVRGNVDPSGKYLLRVQQDGSGTDYLVRYVVDGKAAYKRIVFEHPEERRLP